MKNNILLFCLICLLGVSCKKETNPVSDTQPKDYYPLTANSTWTYRVENNPDLDSFSVKCDAEEVFNGKTYRKLVNRYYPGGWVGTGYGRKSGSEYLGLYDKEEDIEFPFLKDNIPVNTSWNFEYTNQADANTTRTQKTKYTFKEKLPSFNVGDLSFTDVIKVSFNDTTTYMFQGGQSTFISEGDSYYANHVGLIKAVRTDYIVGGAPPITEITNLVRYQVF